MKQAVITGGAGFLAQHLVTLLIKEYDEVICVLKKSKNAKSIEHLDVKIVRADLSDPGSISQLIPEGATVFHCYSLSPGAHASKEVYHKENVTSTIHLLKECEKKKITQLIYVSSCSIIGPNVSKNITEKTIPSPDNLYGESKLIAEKNIQEFHEKTTIPTIIVRLSSLFGPGMHPNTSSVRLFKMTTKPFFPLVGSGENIYEFSYIKNIAAGILLASHKIQRGFMLLNIADQNKITFKRLIQCISLYSNPSLKIIHIPYQLAMGVGFVGDMITKITGKRFPFRTRTVRGILGGWQADPSKAVKVIGLKQKYSTQEGIKETVEWLISKGWMKKLNKSKSK